MPIFAVSWNIQEKEVLRYCFDICRKADFGFQSVVDLGAVSYCTEITCPHLEKETTVPCYSLDGTDVYLRKLQTIQE